MKPVVIKKKCDRCEKFFDIENIKKSRARDLLIQYTPCSHCGHCKDPVIINNIKSGRCADCSIPFCFVDHHSKGRCERCSRRYYRDLERDKDK